MLGLMTASEFDEIKLLTRRIAGMVKAELAGREVDLYDIKLEFGRVGETAQIALIDEISGGNMRAVKDGAFLTPLTLAALVLGDNLVSPRDI
jgi:phosphoribosylaminoimidazole-succinocarboxamide synthase